MYQRGRRYNLKIGSSKDALEITDLQITFDIYKSSNNSKSSNSCTVEIYNLSREHLKVLEQDFIQCVLSVGYEETGLKTIFIGEITQVHTNENGADRVTQIMMGSGYVDLNHSTLSGLIPAGKTVKDVLEEIRKQMPGIVRGTFAGLNINSQVVYGYPITGTPRQVLDELSRTYEIEYSVDNSILSVRDKTGTIDNNKNLALVINKESGLINIPYYSSGDRKEKKKNRKAGVQFTALLNPEIVPGSLIKIESQETNGWFKTDSARYYGDYRGGDWYVDVFCSIQEGLS